MDVAVHHGLGRRLLVQRHLGTERQREATAIGQERRIVPGDKWKE